MSNILKDIKRSISQFLDREYWYNTRKITHLWFDDEDNKWKNSTYPKNARTIINSTWEGESDIWYTVLLKLDHMFWNLKKYGIEKYWYLYSSDINDFGTKEDKAYLTNKVIDEAFKKERDFKNIYLTSGSVSNDLSDNNQIEIYLKYNYDLKTMNLTAKTNKLIPQDKIPKNKKLYTLKTHKDKNGRITFENVLADRYSQKQEYIIDSEYSVDPKECVRVLDLRFDRTMKDFMRLLDIDEINLKNLNDMILDQIDIVEIDYTVEDRMKLSKELKTHATGNFVKCRDILHLRHLIKNLLKISENDSKYDYMWTNIEDYNQRVLAMKEARVHYNADRKAAYHAVADFMCEKSLSWWD